MRIGVVGGGAIGLLTAGYLSKHFPVTLYVRRHAQKEALESNGLEMINGIGSITNLHIETSDSEWKEELMIIAVKQPNIPGLLMAHPKAAIPGQSLLFLQNGASHLDYIGQLAYEHIFVGLVEHGAWKKSDTVVVQRGFGQIKVGKVRGSIEAIQPLLSYQVFPMIRVPDWQKALNEKLLINSVINPLTGLFRVQNGLLVENPYYLSIMKTVFDEVVNVLGFEDTEKEWTNVLQVCRNTKENRSSMLQDIEAHRKTELDAILGVIIQRAKEKHTPVPIIKFLYDSIKGIEEMN